MKEEENQKLKQLRSKLKSKLNKKAVADEKSDDKVRALNIYSSVLKNYIKRV